MNGVYLYYTAPMYFQLFPVIICLWNLGSFSHLTFAIVNVDSDKFKSLLHAGVKTQQKKNHLTLMFNSYRLWFTFIIQ